MKTSQRGFIVPLILIIIALVLVSGGAYLYQQSKQTNQSTTTADLKTYSNTSYGFEFEYPATYVVTPSKDGILLTSANDTGRTITFVISPIPNGKTLTINCPQAGEEDANSIVDGFHSVECKNMVNANGVKYTRAINTGMSTEQAHREQILKAYFLDPQESVIIQTVSSDSAGNVLPARTSAFDGILDSIRIIDRTTSIGQTQAPGSLAHCEDFSALSSDLLKAIGNVGTTSAVLAYPVQNIPRPDVGFTLPIDMTKHDPESDSLWTWENAAPKSIRWRRNAHEPFINYPLTTGIILYYTEEPPFSDKNYNPVFITLINKTLAQQAVTISSNKLGLSSDPLNTYIVDASVNTLTDGQFGAESRVYGFKKGQDLYSISLNDGEVTGSRTDLRPGDAARRASVIITCGQSYQPWDHAFDVLETEISTSTPFDSLSYIGIVDASLDEKVYGISSNVAPFNGWEGQYYVINESMATQVKMLPYSTLLDCEFLEKQKVGKGITCGDASGTIRKVTY